MEGKAVIVIMMCWLASMGHGHGDGHGHGHGNGIGEVKFAFENRALELEGGQRFNQTIGFCGALAMLASATRFIAETLFSAPADVPQKQVSKITLILEDISGVAYASGEEIHLSQSYVAGYSGDLAKEVKGVLYHESTHIWQWNGQGQAPGGLIEGIADWIRLRAALPANGWVQPGGGDKWDEGYSITAFFLDYCESLKSGFVRDLNAKLADGWSPTFFQDLLGQTVDQLWQSYKLKYKLP